MITKILKLVLAFLLMTIPVLADCILPGYLPTKVFDDNAVNIGLDSLVKVNSTTIFHFYSRGLLVSAKGQNQVVKRAFDIPSRTWSAETVVYEETGKNLAPGVGMIGNSVYVFIRRANAAVSVFEDVIVINSTDLTASSWSAPTVVYTFGAGQRGNPNGGTIVSTGTANEYINPFYFHVGSGFESGAGTWYVGYIKTIDGGTSWVTNTTGIYAPPTGVTYLLGEMTFKNFGGSNILGLMRDSGKNIIRQSHSTDGGDNWSNADTGGTNLGLVLTNDKILSSYYDGVSDRFLLLYHDRSIAKTLITYADPDTVIASPTSWPTPFVIAGGYTFVGNPAISKVATDLYLLTYSRSDGGGPGSHYDMYWTLFKVGDCFDPGNSICGDEIVDPGEQCDNDLGPVGGDGCSAICQTEDSACGDGNITGAEECDDGNSASGDGCSNICIYEASGIPDILKHGLELE